MSSHFFNNATIFCMYSSFTFSSPFAGADNRFVLRNHYNAIIILIKRECRHLSQNGHKSKREHLFDLCYHYIITSNLFQSTYCTRFLCADWKYRSSLHVRGRKYGISLHYRFFGHCDYRACNQNIEASNNDRRKYECDRAGRHCPHYGEKGT